MTVCLLFSFLILQEEDIGRAALRPQRPLHPIQAKVEYKDPWVTLDPDEPATTKERPFKKGKY